MYQKNYFMFNSPDEESCKDYSHNYSDPFPPFNDDINGDNISLFSMSLIEPVEEMNSTNQKEEEKDLFENKDPNSLEASLSLQNSTNNDTNKLINNENNIEENCPQNLLQKKRKSSTKEKAKTSDDNKKKKYGRKNESEKNKGIHKRDSEDNIVNKIKGWIFHFIRDIISKYSGSDIKKLKNNHKANLKKEDNMKLFKEKIKDILCREEISTKYSNFQPYENRYIVERIMHEQNEIIKKYKINNFVKK